MADIVDVLRRIGLTKQESIAYLALLTLQEAQTGVLCKETRIASSNIYKILDLLRQKGLVSYRVQNNIKVFMPSPPEALNELFLEKERRIEQERREIRELISKLEVRKFKEPQSNYKYYEGISGIKAMWYENISLLPDLDKSTVIKVYAAEKKAYEKLLGFYREYQKARKKSGVRQQLIIPPGEVRVQTYKEFEGVEIRYTELKNKAEWGVLGDVFFIQHITTKTPRGFLIKDRIFAETFSQVFDQIWKESRTS